MFCSKLKHHTRLEKFISTMITVIMSATFLLSGIPSQGGLHPNPGVEKAEAAEATVKKIAAGEDHTIALKTDGTLWAWGLNAYGEVGNGTAVPLYSPVKIGTDTNWSAIAAGYVHTVALKTDGTLWAWGYNFNGALGDGTTVNKSSPVQIGTDTNWSAIAAGQDYTVALKTDGTLWAWGYNGSGQLGDGTTVNKSSPVQIGTDTNWSAITAGGHHTVALKTDGTLWAWGYNGSGQLGDGTTVNKSSPVQIGTDTNWSAIAAGEFYTIALKTDGTLWAWGRNGNRQLGDGTTVNKSSPVQIGTDTNWSAIAAGVNHTVALKTDGTLWAWGYNGSGQLGDGTTVNKSSPVQIGTNTNWSAIAVSFFNTFALKTDGTLWAWGSGGGLGEGTNVTRLSPVQIIPSPPPPDVTPPGSFTPKTPIDGSTVNKSYPYFSWNPSADSGSGLAKYQLYIDGALARDNISRTAIVPPTPLSNGSHTWFVRAWDNAGNHRDSEVRNVTVNAGPGKIAFVSNRDGNTEIYIMDPDGSHQIRLTNNGSIDDQPSFSPDGSKIVFMSSRAGGSEIFVMNADGSNVSRITNNTFADYSPSFSPDGSKILFSSNRDGNYEIYSMNQDGTNPTRLTNNPAYDYDPVFTADGSKVVFMTNRNSFNEIFSMDPDGSNQTRLSVNDNGQYPATSSDGEKIAFDSHRNPTQQIYSMNTNGSAQTNLSANSFWDYYPSFSPDDSKIAFGSYRGGNDEIYSMNSNGTGQINLTNNAAFDSYPTWGPAAPPDEAAPGVTITNPIEGANVSGTIDINATINDAQTGTSNITEATYSVDGGAPVQMSATDGLFNSPTENVTAQLNSTTLSNGNHTIAVSGKDAVGNWSSAVSVNVNVSNNNAPFLDAIGNKNVNEGSNLSFSIGGSDPDGDPLTYSATNLPAGATFNPTTREFSWTPNYSQAGTYPNIHFEVSDGKGGTDSEDIIITVNNAAPPDTTGPTATIINPLENQVIGGILNLSAIVDDATTGNSNITEATYSIDGGALVQMNASDGSFNSPTENVASQLNTTTLSNGNHTIAVMGRDSAGNWSNGATVNVNVQNILLNGNYMLVAANANPGGANEGPVLRYKFSQTTSLSALTEIPANMMNGPSFLEFNSKGELFAGNRHPGANTGSISRFTFNANGDFNANGRIEGNSLSIVNGLDFSPNGELFVGNTDNGKISRLIFDDQGNAIPNGTINSIAPAGLAFSVNGELFSNDHVSTVYRLRFDPNTGNVISSSSFSIPGASGLHGQTFGPNGELFVASLYTDKVFRYNFDDLGNPVANGIISIADPIDLAFSPDGELFVSNHMSGGISRYTFDQLGNASLKEHILTPYLGGVAIWPKYTQTDTQAPSVLVTNPAEGQLVSGNIDIAALTNDTNTGNSKVVQAIYRIDNGTAVIMSASDGSFNSPTENVISQLDTSTLSNGNHTITVKAKDSAGNWSTATSVNVNVLNSPLVGWWEAEGNANDSKGSNHGTLVNGTTFSSGRIGQAFKLDGVDDYVRVPDSPAWDFGTGDFTIGGWVITPTPSATMRLMGAGSKLDGAYNVWAFGYGSHPIWGSGNRLNFAVWNGSSYDDYSSDQINISSNTYYHVTVNRAGSSLTFYVNGVARGSRTITSNVNGGSTGALIGARYDASPSDIIEKHNGLIDDLRVYKRSLTATEVADLYNSAPVPENQSPSVIIANPTEGQLISGNVNINAVIDDVLRGNSNIAEATYSVDGGTPVQMTASDGSFNSPTESVTGQLNTATLSNGIHTIAVMGRDSAGNWSSSTSINVNVFNSYLVSWWQAESNANDSKGSNHGTQVNGATFSNGRIGQAFKLDGVDDYVSIGNPVPSTLQIQNEITLSSWIYVTQYPSSNTLGLIVGSQNDSNGAGASIFLDGRTSPDGQTSPAGHIHFQIGDGSWHTTNVNAQVPLNQWVHVVATRKANENAKVYYNGVSKPLTSVPWNGTVSYTGASFQIGRQRDESGAAYRYFNGNIDDVRVYNRALSATEVSDLYNSAPTPETQSPLVAITNPTEGQLVSGNLGVNATVDDVSTGNSNITEATYSVDGGAPVQMTASDGSFSSSTENVTAQLNTTTLSNGSHTIAVMGKDAVGNWSSATSINVNVYNSPLVSWWAAEGNANDSVGNNNGILRNGATFAQGKVGQAFSLDGVDDYVDISSPVNVPVNNSPRTVTAWINSKGSTGKYQTFLGYGSPSDLSYNPIYNTKAFLLERGVNQFNDKLTLIGWNHDFASNSLMDFNKWYFVAATYDGTTAKLYINGQLDGTSQKDYNTVLNQYGLRIGDSPPNDGWHENFKGLIDEVKIYNTKITDSEIAEIYASYPTDIVGPTITITNPADGLLASGNININAALDDSKTGNSNITESTYSVDGGAPVQMAATDGSFNSPTENVTAQLNTIILSDGNHTITVASKDSAGNWSLTASVNVTVNNILPVADAGQDQTADSGEIVTFDASASSGNIQEYKWNFGDGSPEFTSSSVVATHTYNTPGTYTAILTIIDNQGDTSTDTTTVTINPAMIQVTFDTVDQYGNHLNGQVTKFPELPGTNAPAVASGANGGLFIVSGSWGGQDPPGSHWVYINVFKDTTYFVDAQTGNVTREEITPGVNKVNFVFEPINVTLDTVDQYGNHLNGQVTKFPELPGTNAPAVASGANGGLFIVSGSWGGQDPPGSHWVYINVFKDTTYFVDAQTGNVTREEITPGVNKVNFVFETIDLTVDTIDQNGNHLDGYAYSYWHGGWETAPHNYTYADGSDTNVSARWNGLVASVVQGNIKDHTYWVNAKTRDIIRTEVTPGVNKVNFVFETIDLTVDTIDQNGNHLDGYAYSYWHGGWETAPHNYTYADGSDANVSARWNGLVASVVQGNIKDHTYWVDARTATIVRTESTPGTNKINFVFENRVPEIISSAPVIATEGNPYAYDVEAIDPEGYPMTYSLASNPEGMSIDPSTGQISWMPSYDQSRSHDVVVEVSDGSLTAQQSFTINVINTNRAPSMEDISDKAVDEETNLLFALNGSDPDISTDNDEISYSSTNMPQGATLDQSTGQFSWTPQEDQGPNTYDITFKVTDKEGQSSETATKITVKEINKAPEITPIDNKVLNEEEILSFTVNAADSDIPDQTLAYLLQDAPTGMTIDPVSGEVIWIPKEDQGPNTYNFKVGVTDSEATSYTDVQVEVKEVNTAPTLDEVSNKSLNETETLSFTISGFDKDIPNNSLSYSASNLPTGATFDPETKTFTWTPAYEQAGTYTVNFQVSDGELAENQDVSITVNNVNRTPVASNQSVSTDEDTSKNITLSATDEDGDALSYTVVSQPQNGILIGAAPNLTYIPNANFSGTDSFTFKANDGEDDSSTATVDITVSPVNDSPVAENDSAATDEDNAVTINVLSNDSDIDEDTLVISSVASPSNGEAAINPDKTITYTPNQNYNGSDSFSYTIDDGSGGTDSATVNITVSPVNDAPTLEPIGNLSVDENSSLNKLVLATDIDGDLLSFSAADIPLFASIIDNTNNTALLSISPGFDDAGTYNTQISVSDGSLIDTELVQLTINNVNRAPVLETIGDKAVNENQELSFTVLAIDPDGNSLTYSAAGLPDGASFDSATKTFTWTPNFDQAGSYEVTFETTDGDLSDSETISIDVSNTNRVPVIMSTPNLIASEGSQYSYDAEAIDPDGDTLTFSLTTSPAGMSIDPSTGQIFWIPGFDQSGNHDAVVKVSDGSLTAQQTFTINVINTNRAPSLEDIPNKQVDEETELLFTLSGSDPDIETDSDQITYSSPNLPDGATLDQFTGQFSWTSPEDQGPGIYDVKFQVKDKEGLSSEKTAHISVSEVNTAPVLGEIADQQTSEDQALTFEVNGFDNDKPDNTVSYSATNLPDGATFDAQTKELSWTPTYEQAGSYTVGFEVSDGTLSDSQVVQITVNNVNRSPAASAGGPYVTDEGSVITFNAVGSSDPDRETLQYRWDFDGDGLWDTDYSASSTVIHTWNDDYIGSVKVEVSDGDLTDVATAGITINNVTPTAFAGEDKEAYWGDEVSFSGSYTDPGINDNPVAIWDFGDGDVANGFNVSHIYNQPGSYNTAITVTDKDGGFGTDNASVNILKRPTTLTYEGSNSSDYSDIANLKATLKDNRGLPVSQTMVKFIVGTQQITALTDESGQAQASIKIDQLAGNKELTVSFVGDELYLASSMANTFNVTKESTAISYAGDAITQRNQIATLKAQLSETDSSVGDLSGKDVVFTITNGTGTQTVNAVTDENGLATTTAQVTITGGLYNVSSSFAADGYYIGSTSASTPYVIWEAIPGLNVNGGGWLLNNGKKSNFGFTAKYVSSSNIPIGQLEYIDRNVNLNLHSEGFDWLVITAESIALLEGTAEINGQSGHTFRLIVSDNGTPGAGKDSFELQIDGLPLTSGLISGGNIVLH